MVWTEKVTDFEGLLGWSSYLSLWVLSTMLSQYPPAVDVLFQECTMYRSKIHNKHKYLHF